MNKKLFSSSFLDGFLIEEFACVAQKIDVPQYFEILPRQKFRLDLELLLFWRALKAALSSGAALLFSSRGYMKPELFASIAMGFLPKRFRPAVVLYGEMFHADTGILGLLERFVMKLVDRSVCFYIVYSTDELELFPKLWGVDRRKMCFCPLYLIDERVGSIRSTKPVGKYIFAGGNSYRDYGPVIEAARQLPEFEFVLATKKLPESSRYPPNVRVDWMSLDKYLDLINGASVVLVPLISGLKRTIGLLTVLESLSLGKMIVVPEALGIHDYVTDGKTGFVVTDLPDGYVKAIRWILAPENQDRVSNICMGARRSVSEQFTLEKYVETILSIMGEAIETRATYRRK